VCPRVHLCICVAFFVNVCCFLIHLLKMYCCRCFCLREQTAKREVLEEIGYQSDQWVHLYSGVAGI
jgi:hypothetical protein